MVLAVHDIGDAEVGEHDCSDRQDVIHLPSNEGLVVSDCFGEPVSLHEEDMGHIELPGLMLTAELSRLSKDLLYLGIVALVPIHFRLHHEDRDILVQGGIILLQGRCDGFGVSCNSRILN